MGRRLVALVVVLALAACDGLLDVELPNVIPPEKLEGEEGIRALYGGGRGQFAEIWSGGGGLPGRVLISGLVSDEFYSTAPLIEFDDVDRRDTQPDHRLVDLEFVGLQRARFALEDGVWRIHELQLDPASDSRIGELWALAGYTYLALAEDFCAGITVSEYPESGVPVFGSPLSGEEVLEVALERFAAALQWTGGRADVEALARLGSARALLTLGRFAEAAGEAVQVPDGFQYVNEHGESTSGNSDSFRLPNSVYGMGQSSRRWSVSEGEGGNGLAFRSAADPRVPVEATPTLGNDGLSDNYGYLMYTSDADPFVMADDVEARLIEAEALLDSGGDWLTVLNDLRTRVGLDPLVDPGGVDARVDLLFSERAFWLFARGNRLSDLRRLVRQYGRAAEDVFPTGSYFKGGTYGPDVNIVLPDSERSNPNFVGCLNRDA